MPTENRSSNAETTSELLPCPFCGQQDFLIERLDIDASVVICQGLTGPHEACLARGPVGVVQDEGEDQPGRDKAVELWNARAEQLQGEQTTCSHEWTDDGAWLLACTKCGAQENHEPYGWVQTRGNAINRFTQEWDIVQEWENQGFQYKAMHDHPAPVDAGEVERLRNCLRTEVEAGDSWKREAQDLREELELMRLNKLDWEGLAAKYVTQVYERSALLKEARGYVDCEDPISPSHRDDLLARIDALPVISTEENGEVERLRAQLAERDAQLRDSSGKLVQMAAHLIGPPLRALHDLVDEDKRMTRPRVYSAVDFADARLKDAAYEIRRIADALSASAESQVKS